MIRAAAVAAALALAMPATALAGDATGPDAPVRANPSAASIADNWPVLTWTIDDSVAQVDFIQLADANVVNEDGRIVAEHVVEERSITDLAPSWRPSARLRAGTYWWTLLWGRHDWEHSGGYLPPISFKIPAYVRGVGFTIDQYDFARRIDLRYAVSSNTSRVRVDCTIHRGLKLVSRRLAIAPVTSLTRPVLGMCSLAVHESLDGARLRARVTVTSEGRTATFLRLFNAR